MSLSRLTTIATLLALSLPSGARAQRVVADISIHQGPVAGHVIIGDRYRPAPRPIVIVEPRTYHRPSYRTITVYRVHRGHGWYRARGYRSVRVWYDARDRRYYDCYHAGLREVSVYEREGRYYHDDWRDDDRHHGYRH